MGAARSNAGGTNAKINTMKFKLWLRLALIAAAVIALQISAIPQLPRLAYLQARAFAGAGDHRRAALELDTALAYEPWSTNYLALSAAEHLETGDVTTSRRQLELLAQLRPLTADEVITLAALRWQQHEPDRAMRVIQDAVSRNALQESDLRQTIANAFQARSWWRALAALHGLVALRPDDNDAQSLLSMVEALLLPDQSAATIDALAARDPRWGARLDDLRKFIAVRSTFAPETADTRLGAIYIGLNQYELADDVLTRAVNRNPAFGEALAYLAFAHAKLHRPALGIMQQAIALAPNSPLTRIMVGLTWKTLGRNNEARAEFERAYALDPTNPSTALEIANTHRAQSSSAFAEVWLKEAVRLSGGDLRFRIVLAQFYVDDNYRVLDAGLPFAQQLVLDAPDSAEAHDALGWAYFLLGGLDRAAEQLARALTLDPTLARIHLHRGALLEAQGNSADAINEYHRAAELDPDGAFGTLAIRALERLNP